MNQILVLVDFTETANIALAQGLALAKLNKVGVAICHVFDLSVADNEMIEKLQAYGNKADSAGVPVEYFPCKGDFFTEVVALSERIRPLLVIAGTHGKVGFKQNLVGSNIYKLVSKISGSTLVVSDAFRVEPNGFRKVMMPVSAHSDYTKKVTETIKLLSRNGQVEIFALYKPGVTLSQKTQDNITNAQEILREKGVDCHFYEADAQKFSVGYSKESIALVKERQGDLISIMVDITEESLAFGKIDKENLILNKDGIAVLCIN